MHDLQDLKELEICGICRVVFMPEEDEQYPYGICLNCKQKKSEQK